MSFDKIDKQLNCVLCGSVKKADYLYSSRSTKGFSEDIYDYFRCQDCGFAFLNPKPQPTAEQYDGYYKNLRPLNMGGKRDLIRVVCRKE